MTHHDNTNGEAQLMLLDESTEDEKTPGTDLEWAAHQEQFTRQIALEKAVQISRVALAHGRIGESHAADFTVSAAEKFFAYLTK